MKRQRKVKVWEGRITLPVYGYHEDVQPDLFQKLRNWAVAYPYPRNDVFDSVKRPHVYRALFLENEYLRVTVLPELGGHLYSAYDKLKRREVFYRVSELKPGALGRSGAWGPLGVEFNFPSAHSPTTLSPVDGVLRRNPDGSASVVVGDIERVSRMQWSVDITLRPRHYAVETLTTLHNRTPLPHGCYCWTNAAIPVSDGTRYVIPAPGTTFHGMTRGSSGWPVRNGVDLSWHRNIETTMGVFARGCREDFLGAYDVSHDWGVVHVADYRLMPGKKIFDWGTGPAGVRKASEFGGPQDGCYAEIQAGVFETQPGQHMLRPYSTVRFTETWCALHGMGLPFSRANRHAAVVLEPDEKHGVHVAVNVTRPRPGCRILLKADGRRLLDVVHDVSPETPFSTVVRLRAGHHDTSDLELSLICPRDGLIISHRPARLDNRRVSRAELRMETGDGDDSAGELTVKGLNAEKTGLWYQADRWYRQALQRDPDFGPAQLHMGILHLRGGRWRKAVGCLRRAVERDPDLPEANYYLGLAYAGMGEDGPAKDAFWAALRDQAGDACCLTELGRLSMRQKDFEEAAGHLSRALAAAPDETRAAGMLSASLRHMGRPEQALRTLEPMLFRFPADYLLRSEACLASVSLKMEPRARRESEAFLRLMDGRPESYLELAADYAGTGLFSEALTVIESGIAATSSRTYTYPMLCYHAGHCLERLGRTREAKNLYRRARRMRPDCCFPGRVESIAVLERVLDLFPDDANAAAYLGCILYHRTRRADATRLWQQAQRLTGDSVLLCTNLALASWDHDDFRGALYWLRRAMRIEPDNVKAVLWMDSVLAETGDGKKRLTLLEKACTKHPDDDDIREHCGSLLLDLGRPGKALDMILNHRFRTRHGVFNLTRLYLNARTALGEKAMAGGDYGRALDQFEKARSAPVSLGEDATSFRFFGKVHYLAGECLERLGRKAEARKSYRMCVAERRPRLPALSYYDYLSCMRLGKREAAQKALNRIRQTLEQIEAARDVKSGYRHYLRSLYLRALGRRRQAQEEAGRARLKGWRASDELRFGPGFGFA